jgi:type III secretion protein F
MALAQANQTATLYNGVTPADSSPGASSLWNQSLVNTAANAVAGAVGTGATYVNMDGLDLVWSQAQLQTQMANVEEDIVNIQNNANLSDTEKMFSMQMAINTWSAISLTRTNELKTISDTLKSIVRNLD